MICSNCGKENNNTSNFCKYCGAKLNQDEYPNYNAAMGNIYASPDVMRGRKIKNAITEIFKKNE